MAAEGAQSDAGSRGGDYWQNLQQAKEGMLPIGKEVQASRGPLTKGIMAVERVIAHPGFYVGLLVTHLGWIVLNAGWIGAIRPWDPYPFTFLATIASVEAPFITLMVLMAQRRQRRLNELREELDFQVALHDERETTEALRMLDAIQKHLGVEGERDPARAEAMQEDLDPKRLLEQTRGQLEESEGHDPNVD